MQWFYAAIKGAGPSHAAQLWMSGLGSFHGNLKDAASPKQCPK